MMFPTLELALIVAPKLCSLMRAPKTKILLDGGNPGETLRVKHLLGFLDGQTTNPSLVAKNPDVKRLVILNTAYLFASKWLRVTRKGRCFENSKSSNAQKIYPITSAPMRGNR